MKLVEPTVLQRLPTAPPVTADEWRAGTIDSLLVDPTIEKYQRDCLRQLSWSATEQCDSVLTQVCGVPAYRIARMAKRASIAVEFETSAVSGDAIVAGMDRVIDAIGPHRLAPTPAARLALLWRAIDIVGAAALTFDDPQLRRKYFDLMDRGLVCFVVAVNVELEILPADQWHLPKRIDTMDLCRVGAVD